MCSGVGILLGASRSEALPKADIIVHHAKVFTANPNKAWAQAVAIKGGKVMAVGTNVQMLGFINPCKTKLINAGGRTVVPGINDAHVHALATPGALLNYQNLGFIAQGQAGPELPEVLGMIAGATASLPPGTWLTVLVGEGINQDDSATRFALDTVSPDHPVWLQMWTGHGSFVNSKALETLGIDDDAPDPMGGHFERVEGTNILSGSVHEYAEHALRRRLLDTVPDAQLVASYKSFASAALARGITSIQDIPVGLTQARAIAVLEAANLPLRVRSICFPLSADESCSAQPAASMGHKIDASGVKWITDGTPVERRAFVGTPYQDAPNEMGEANFSAESLEDLLLPGLGGIAKKQQRLFHAVGDGAIGRVLDAVDATGGADSWSGRRVRIEHGDMLFDDNYDRLIDAGMVIVQNPLHFALPHVFSTRFVPSVRENIQPLGSLIQAGIPVAFGSDSFGAPPNPWLEIMLATMHPTRPEEAISVQEAVVAYTRTAAYAEFSDDIKGQIAPGYWADLAILSQDPFTAPPQALPGTTSVLTMVHGKVEFNPTGL